jgi:hypothetical protein
MARLDNLRGKLEIRNPKLETNSNVKIPNTKTNRKTMFAYFLFHFRFCFGFRVSGFGFVALLVLVAGCSAKHPYGEVEGTVTLDGRPLGNVEVVFLPDPEKGNTGKRSVALTDAQGRYRLSSDTAQEGAPVGFHRVCINDLLAGSPGVAGPQSLTSSQRPGPTGASDPAAQPQKESRARFPPEYGSALGTPFRDIEIKPGSQRIDLDVHRQLPR